MSKVTPIEPTTSGHAFDKVYHELGDAIGDAKAVANLLTVVDKNECDVNHAGYAQERILERAEDILSKIWKFHPDH